MALLCLGIVWILKLAFPTLLFLAGEPSAGDAARPPSVPSLPAHTIHLRLPRARNVAPGHCGACSQSLSSSFHSGFYKLAFIPRAVVWFWL